jgi:hypothetical protein
MANNTLIVSVFNQNEIFNLFSFFQSQSDRVGVGDVNMAYIGRRKGAPPFTQFAEGIKNFRIIK